MYNEEIDRNLDETGVKEECGVFGIYDFEGREVASTIYYGLFALQHRGQIGRASCRERACQYV